MLVHWKVFLFSKNFVSFVSASNDHSLGPDYRDFRPGNHLRRIKHRRIGANSWGRRGLLEGNHNRTKPFFNIVCSYSRHSLAPTSVCPDYSSPCRRPDHQLRKSVCRTRSIPFCRTFRQRGILHPTMDQIDRQEGRYRRKYSQIRWGMVGGRTTPSNTERWLGYGVEKQSQTRSRKLIFEILWRRDSFVVLTNPRLFVQIASRLNKPFVFGEEPLIVQYEVQLQVKRDDKLFVRLFSSFFNFKISIKRKDKNVVGRTSNCFRPERKQRIWNK